MRNKHGLSSHPLYKRWKNMHDRCYNKNRVAYRNYGARGIAVCDRWHEFQNFYDDMIAGFSESLELDRIDNNNGYGPDNCRWISRRENSRNRRQRVSKKEIWIPGQEDD